MGKSNRAAAAERAAQMRAEAARQERQRKQVIAAVIAVVVVIVAVVLGTVVANRPSPSPAATGSTGAEAALAKLVAIPPATLDAAPTPQPSQAPAKLAGATPLTQDGKSKVLYVGAEYCPFCAMERWVMIGALSRFGTFSGIKPTTSSSSDVHPDTPTFSFHGASFTSDHLAFEAVETEDREGKPLDTLEGANAELFKKYNPGGGIPWVNYGGTHATSGATVDATVFDGKTYDQIIAGIYDPTSEIGKTVDPAINMVTAQLCQQTNGQPSNVCASKAVMAATPLLQK
ncbi:hypothetical protein N865_20175 [Intrasporangium oryzae NRRL B-24470]|uniref:DUF929 domain-containing protein n=1 Tax=Intrasporangium oryzae NRRL B-24470 TaxID=1386089 RepID=W9G1M6_9MICO|nr:DUF929 family protein [Intrasporangium oryzae]EWS99859.1 hypothetical protein N865_20175 [Intrasporangium oryzae NRRL B-24470]